MPLTLSGHSDPRKQLEAASLWKPGTPLKLAFFPQGGVLPNFINISSDSSTNANPLAIHANTSELEFPAMSVNEIVVLDGLSALGPIETISFISRCASSLAILGRITFNIFEGHWVYPHNNPICTWNADALIAVLDHAGLLVDYVSHSDEDGLKRVTISGGRLQGREALFPKIESLHALIEGPLCSLGCVPQDRTREFYSQCLKALNLSAPPEFTKPYTFHVPTAKSDRLKILHTVEFYAPNVGGAELVVKHISEGLVQRGHSVTVATSHLPDRHFKELNGVHIEQFKVTGRAAMGIPGSDVARYIQFIKDFPCDVMLNYAAQQWATDLALPLYSQLNNRVKVLAPCGYSAMQGVGILRSKEYHNYFHYILPRALSFADAVIYHSALYQDYEFAKAVGLSNDVIIPNAVDEAEFAIPPNVNFREKYRIREKFVLLCVGNFMEGKGQGKLIEIMRNLRMPDVALVLIGRDGGTLQRNQELAGNLPVYFLTDIPRADTVSAYFNADLFTFASNVEASPLVILEAKAARLPFLSTDVGNVRELAGGIICSLAEMPECIIKLLNDPELRSTLGEEGWKEYLSKHTWTKVIDNYEDLYQRLHFLKQRSSLQLHSVRAQ